MSEDNGNQQQPQAGPRAENPVKIKNNRHRERERIEMEETVPSRASTDRGASCTRNKGRENGLKYWYFY